MLIYLDEDIINNLDDTSVFAIQNIAECVRAGRHIIVAKRSLLKKLYMLTSISDVDRRVFKKLYSQVTQYGSLKNRIKTYIHISSSVKNVEKKVEMDHVVYIMPVQLFSDCSNFQKTKLICEDLFDCEFYQSLAKYYMEQNHLSGKINFEKINGGGLNTSKNYEEKLNSNYTPCLAIIDSDKTSPEGMLGKTAQYVNAVCNKYDNNHVTYTHTLKVREKENLIPPEIYYNLESDAKIKEDFEFLLKMYNSEYKDSYLFGDIKSGFDKKADQEMLKEFITVEVKKLVDEDFAIDELKEYGKQLKQMIGDNVFCSVVDELYREPVKEKENIIHGVRSAFGKFKESILEGKLKDRNAQKKEIVEKHGSKTLKEEVAELETILDTISDVTKLSIKNEFEEYWKEIASICYEWGCKFHIHVA